MAPAVRTERTLMPAAASRAGPVGRGRRLASAVHFGDVLAGAAACGEQVVDRGHRFERLHDGELRPDLGGGYHLQPFGQGAGHRLRGGGTEPAHAEPEYADVTADKAAGRREWRLSAAGGVA